MLTGNSKPIGEVVGEKLTIEKENIFTQLLLQDKVAKFEEIKNNNNGKVAFVGDGVNDVSWFFLS